MSTNFDEIFCRVGFVIMTGSRRLDFVDDSDRDAAAAAKYLGPMHFSVSQKPPPY